MFRKQPEVLKEAFEILTSKYKNSWTVTNPFKIIDDAIVFTGDSYYDPVLTILALSEQGIIDAKASYAGTEQDKITISGCNIEILRKLEDQWPAHSTVESVLEKIGYKKPINLEEKDDNTDIILEGGESGIVVKRELWDEYWKCKGKKGPESGWDIPTIEQIYETILEKSKIPITKFFSAPPKAKIDKKQNSESTNTFSQLTT